MENIIKQLVKSLIEESINYSPENNEVYFGNIKKPTDEILIDNDSGGLREKVIDTYSNLTLNNVSAKISVEVDDLEQPDQNGFAKSRKLVIGSDIESGSGRIKIKTYNLYNKIDLKTDTIAKYENLPDATLYYGQAAKKQYTPPGKHPEWMFDYSDDVAKDAASDFLNNNMILNLLNEFKPEVIICPDSSSILNQEILLQLRKMFPSSEVFSTTKISTATFFDESSASTDLKVRRAEQQTTPFSTDEYDTRADYLDVRHKRNPAEIAQLNKTGVSDPGAIEKVNTEILTKTFFKIFNELHGLTPSQAAKPENLKVKIHKVGALSKMQAWRNYLSRLHFVTYSKESMPIGTFTSQSGGIVNARDLIFNSAIMYSSLMFVYLTQGLVSKVIQNKKKKNPSDQWVLSNKINENKKRLKESYNLSKSNEIQKYIEDLQASMLALSQMINSAATIEEKEEIQKQLNTLTGLHDLMVQANDTQNYTKINDIKDEIDRIMQPSQGTIKDYELISELISSVVLEAFSDLLTKASDFILDRKDQVKIQDILDIVSDWFAGVFERIINISANFASFGEDDESYTQKQYNQDVVKFNNIIKEATAALVERAQDDSESEAAALEVISKNPEVLFVTLEIIIKAIQDKSLEMFSGKVSQELKSGNNEVDINSFALEIIDNIYNLIPEKNNDYTTFEDIIFKKSQKPGKIDITIIPTDDDSKYASETTVTISIFTLFDLEIIDINKENLASQLASQIKIGMLTKDNKANVNKFKEYIEKSIGIRLKRVLIIDDNISTGATLAGIKRDILNKIEEYQKQSGSIVDINFEYLNSSSISSDKFGEIDAASDVSVYRGKASEIMTQDILLNDIICITPMIV